MAQRLRQFVGFWLLLWAAVAAAAPDILLANVYRNEIDPAPYLVSEKLDGVRAIWDGQSLKTRSGRVINAPVWFVDALPAVALDGELWIARQRFDEVSGTVRREVPVDAEWRKVRYMLFELPGAGGTFAQRVEQMQAIISKAKVPWLQVIEQRPAVNRESLKKWLARVVKQGGEGLMLHRADAPYETGRSDTLLKLKPALDAEGVVVRHLPGKGKYEGMLGALEIRLADGKLLRLGSGFSDEQRKNPPPPGALVTYRYRDLTAYGVPRFATFVRVREE
ncbi:DNA ligase [Dechloromonas sp.]|uniref:DNA ligase n=1 Tax=Dechloromonas sp. TaxID=1917218 RepID=UPI00122AF756|nr:DNA ligase [Dechloromonas sp.]MBU3698246.1 DNA ligase [Dechloromonas sp.]TEX47967.1 MAG: DNA ligase [Rhodocyclaceae bacterium]